ncbi:armadillo repeat-containing protein 4 armc4 [Anaeramoeba ignava]|uniref:Armadillo repeat-containing protein 4 armc4 n=1 Tax=Anaeramoeba ignava TaxID=1746090 RepID=A0A9Q0R914_ANAIG|nr:armadillo repeat-containing protein 4 armc4 [Anaeramoeba ignava]
MNQKENKNNDNKENKENNTISKTKVIVIGGIVIGIASLILWKKFGKKSKNPILLQFKNNLESNQKEEEIQNCLKIIDSFKNLENQQQNQENDQLIQEILDLLNQKINSISSELKNLIIKLLNSFIFSEKNHLNIAIFTINFMTQIPLEKDISLFMESSDFLLNLIKNNKTKFSKNLKISNQFLHLCLSIFEWKNTENINSILKLFTFLIDCDESIIPRLIELKYSSKFFQFLNSSNLQILENICCLLNDFVEKNDMWISQLISSNSIQKLIELIKLEENENIQCDSCLAISKIISKHPEQSKYLMKNINIIPIIKTHFFNQNSISQKKIFSGSSLLFSISTSSLENQQLANDFQLINMLIEFFDIAQKKAFSALIHAIRGLVATSKHNQLFEKLEKEKMIEKIALKMNQNPQFEKDSDLITDFIIIIGTCARISKEFEQQILKSNLIHFLINQAKKENEKLKAHSICAISGCLKNESMEKTIKNEGCFQIFVESLYSSYSFLVMSGLIAIRSIAENGSDPPTKSWSKNIEDLISLNLISALFEISVLDESLKEFITWTIIQLSKHPSFDRELKQFTQSNF